MNKNNLNCFLVSAFTEENPFMATEEVKTWLRRKNDEVDVRVEQIDFADMAGWSFTEGASALVHDSGKFFSLEGIHVHTKWLRENEWEQPIINQPEIGYLGIIAKEFNGVLFFLLQAKIEPGNINNVQLSPTLQATKSNYDRVHGGQTPAFLRYFRDRQNDTVLLDQLQSEQGARFLKKRNRNIIVQVHEAIDVPDGYIWLTLGQIKKLMRSDNLVNMDTRTVISGIGYQVFEEIGLNNARISDRVNLDMFISYINKGVSLFSFEDLIAWITGLKCSYELSVRNVPLSRLRNWTITRREIVHDDSRFFKVIGTRIHIANREVHSWCQPLVQPSQEGLIAFIIRKIHGVMHFLVQAKLECGNLDILELAPTVQCLTGDYRRPDYTIPFLNIIMNTEQGSIRYDSMQSEEGGRFYREQNRNLIIEVFDDFPIKVPENYTWMTLHQITTFIKFNNYLNIQARSLISAIEFI